MTEAPADLVVLCADADARLAIEGLLSRPAELGIRPVSVQFVVHPERDPGCLLRGHEIVRPFVRTHRFALVTFDREGCGRDAKPRSDLEADVEVLLGSNGWGQRAAAIVFDPEVEAWIWSSSPAVERVLGWRDPSGVPLRDWLVQQGLTASATSKPTRPKEAFRAALKRVRRPPSAALFLALARSVETATCVDPAFSKFRDVLRAWFPG